MTLRKAYYGTHGPHYYDDADPVNDPDGDFSGENGKGILTDGVNKQYGAPADNNDNVRLVDLTNTATIVEVSDITDPSEITSYGGDPGTRLMAFQKVSGGRNYFTVYALDKDGPAESRPEIVDAEGSSGERWIAISGKCVAGDLAAHSSQHEAVGSDSLYDQDLNTTNSVEFDSVQSAYKSSDGSAGWSGTFTNGDGQTVTVKDGIITDVS